jgi:integrase
MIVLMLDTGCRIDEVLNLKNEDVDFDNLLVTVLGKGNKMRRIPFKIEIAGFKFHGACSSTRWKAANRFSRSVELSKSMISLSGWPP